MHLIKAFHINCKLHITAMAQYDVETVEWRHGLKRSVKWTLFCAAGFTLLIVFIATILYCVNADDYAKGNLDRFRIIAIFLFLLQLAIHAFGMFAVFTENNTLVLIYAILTQILLIAYIIVWIAFNLLIFDVNLHNE